MTDALASALSSSKTAVGGSHGTVLGGRELPVLLETVTFENGPVNLLDADSIDELAELITRIEQDPAVTVVVVDSANPDYFIAHWDVTAEKARVAAMPPGPTGQHPYLDNFVRLTKVPAVTISSIRGRVRGAGSEFVLATDIRFAGDKAILGQFDVGFGSVPGGGPMARLARLVGRGRAAEILFGADDFPAALAGSAIVESGGHRYFEQSKTLLEPLPPSSARPAQAT